MDRQDEGGFYRDGCRGGSAATAWLDYLRGELCRLMDRRVRDWRF